MLFIRSILFSILFNFMVLIVSFLVLLSFPFPLKFRLKMSSFWGYVCMPGFEFLCGLTYKIKGLENIPKQPCIVMSNHQSTWETVSFPMIFYPYVWVLKKELLFIPIFGWALGLIGPIAIDRKSGKRAVDQIVEQGQKRLNNGMSIIVFPEGTRVDPRVKRRHGIGGAILAEKTGAKIIPVVHNAGEFWQRRKFFIRPGVIQVSIGPVINSEGKDAVTIQKEVESWIVTELSRINANFDKEYPDKY